MGEGTLMGKERTSMGTEGVYNRKRGDLNSERKDLRKLSEILQLGVVKGTNASISNPL